MTPQNIKPQIHIITGVRVEVSRTDGVWKAVPLDKGGPTGQMTGGRYDTLDEYLSEVRRNYAYNLAFHSGTPRQDAKRIAGIE